MRTKQPTIEDIYMADAFMTTPGIRQGLLERASEGNDDEVMTEDTDDGPVVYYRAPHGEMYPVGRPIMLAAGPSGTRTDAPAGATISPTPRNPVVGGVADFVRGVRDMANQYEIKDWVPLLGKMGVGDLLLGKSPEEIENWAYGNSPIAMPPSGTGGFVPVVKTGRKESLADTVFLGVDAAGLAKGAGAIGRGAVKGAARAIDQAMVEGTGPVARLIPDAMRPMNVVPPGPSVVSTRLPTAKKATEDPLANRLVIDLQSTKADPEAFTHNVGLVSQYPNFVSRARTPDRQAEDFITQVKDNLLWLHDKVPEGTRQRSKLWYDGARNITDRFSSDYGVPDQAVSGVLAVLSPQKDWFMNVSLGQRVLDIATKQQGARWDSSMDEMAKIIWSKPQYAPMVDAIRGKTLGEITDPGLKAMWLRTYDQAKLPREHQIVSPEGDFVGVRTNADGSPTKTGWGSLNEIGKAIVILEDPTLPTISTNLGQQHKVRNFYNNIYAPQDPAGHVTIDTHAVAAGLLRPLSGNSREVLHNFGSGVVGEGGPKNSSITGVQGTYGLYAEAYRRAAQERGILPREMQSITWEAVRGMYPDTFKSQAKNVQAVDSVWLQYRQGKLSLEEARNEVLRLSGGINAPEWERAGLRPEPTQAVQPAGNAGELSGAGVPGGSPSRPGRNQPAASNSSSVTRGGSAPQQGGAE